MTRSLIERLAELSHLAKTLRHASVLATMGSDVGNCLLSGGQRPREQRPAPSCHSRSANLWRKRKGRPDPLQPSPPFALTSPDSSSSEVNESTVIVSGDVVGRRGRMIRDSKRSHLSSSAVEVVVCVKSTIEKRSFVNSSEACVTEPSIETQAFFMQVGADPLDKNRPPAKSPTAKMVLMPVLPESWCHVATEPELNSIDVHVSSAKPLYVEGISRRYLEAALASGHGAT
jgi:hypothetical protein